MRFLSLQKFRPRFFARTLDSLVVLLIALATPCSLAMDFATYSNACQANGGKAIVGSDGVYQCTFPSGRSAGNAAGAGLTPEQQLMMQGVGMVAGAIGQELNKALFGDPEEEAQQGADEAARAEAQQRQMTAMDRQAEEAKRRLLGLGSRNDNGPGALALMDVGTSAGLQLMLGEDALQASTTGANTRVQTGNASPATPRTQAYQMGYDDANQCISQNSGPRCSGMTSAQMQTCVADYQAGYQVGSRRRDQVLNEAEHSGLLAGSNGLTGDAVSDSRASGPCRVQWIEAYQRGYFKGKQGRSLK